MQGATNQQTSINILGAGAIGHLYSASMHQAKIDCRLYSRQPTKTVNCQLISKAQSYTYQQTYHRLSELPTDLSANSTFIICVKAPDLEELCQHISHIDQYQPIILLLMNGMGLVEITNKYLPYSCVLQASTTHGAYLSQSKQSDEIATQIHHTGMGHTIIGDPLQNRLEISTSHYQPRLQKLINTLNKALPETRWQAEFQPVLWQKLIINSVINPLTSLYDVKNGAILKDKKINQLAYQLTKELAPLINIYLPQTSWHSMFDKIIAVAEATQDNISSMRQDIMQAKTTEIDYISGYLLSVAHQQGIDLSLHLKLYGQVKQLEDKF